MLIARTKRSHKGRKIIRCQRCRPRNQPECEQSKNQELSTLHVAVPVAERAMGAQRPSLSAALPLGGIPLRPAPRCPRARPVQRTSPGPYDARRDLQPVVVPPRPSHGCGTPRPRLRGDNSSRLIPFRPGNPQNMTDNRADERVTRKRRRIFSDLTATV